MQSGFRITRRAALLGAAVGGVLGAPAVLRAQGQVRLTLGHGTAPGNPRSLAADRMAAQLRERSNGRIEMRVAGSAQLGDDALDADRHAHRHARHVGEQPGPARPPSCPSCRRFGLPFLFSNVTAAYKVMDGPIGEELAGRFKAVGLIVLGWWDNGIRHITNSKRPINRPGGPARPEDPHPRRPRPPSTPSRRWARRRSRSTSASSTWRCSRAWWTGRRTRSPTSTRASCTR